MKLFRFLYHLNSAPRAFFLSNENQPSFTEKSLGSCVFENIYVSKSKFKWIVSELLKCIYQHKDNIVVLKIMILQKYKIVAPNIGSTCINHSRKKCLQIIKYLIH